jgi:hypothetical protein
MSFLGKHHRQDSRKRISAKLKLIAINRATSFQKGHTPWNKGKPWPDDVKKKLSEHHRTKRGYKPWNAGKEGVNNNWLGRKHSNTSKEKMRKAHLGKYLSEELRKRLSIIQKTLWTEERKKLYSEKFSGHNHPNWQGGRSLEPYDEGFSKSLRRMIRKRDNYACQLCGRAQGNLDVHHIDFSKDNHLPENLISLCRACHAKLHKLGFGGEQIGQIFVDK